MTNTNNNITATTAVEATINVAPSATVVPTATPEPVQTTATANYNEAGAIVSQSQTIKAMKAANEMKVKVKYLVFKMAGEKPSVVIDHSTDGHHAREAMKAGYVGSFSYTLNGNVVQYDNVVLNHVTVEFKNLEQAKLFLESKGGFLLDPGVNAYRIGHNFVETKTGPQKVDAIFDMNGNVVDLTEEYIDTLWKLKASHYSPNSVKKGAAIFYNAAICSDEEENQFLNALTKGGHEFNMMKWVEKGATAADYAGAALRYTAGKAASQDVSLFAENKAIRLVLAKEGIDTSSLVKEALYSFFDEAIQPLLEELSDESYEMLYAFHKTLYYNYSVFLSGHFADGQILVDAEQKAYIWRTASGIKFTGKGMLGIVQQSRPMGTLAKSASMSTTEPALNMFKEAYLASHGGQEYVIDIENLIENEDLAMSVTYALAGDFENSTFSKYDIITIGYPDTNGTIRTQAITSLDEVKHTAMITEQCVNPFLFSENAMKIASAPKGGIYEVNLSNQVSTSLTATDRVAGMEFLITVGERSIEKKFSGLMNSKPKNVLDASKLNASERAYAKTDVQQSMPSVIMKHRVLAVQAIEDVMKSSMKEINKDKVSGLLGADLVIIPDVMCWVDEELHLLGKDEVFAPSYEAIAKYGKKIKLEQLNKLTAEMDLMDKANKAIALEAIKELKEEVDFLEEFIMFIARHPKNSKSQFYNYKVVGIEELESRSIELYSQKGAYRKRHHFILMEILNSLGEGVVMMPSFAYNQLLHSGADYDIDSVVAYLEKGITDLSKDLKSIAADIIFE